MKVYYDKDGNLSVIQKLKVAIVGYGSQGHAHALNLRDSGVDITVGLREGSASAALAESAGLKVKGIVEAIQGADVIMLLLPDEDIAQVYKEYVEPHAPKGAYLGFAHGFNIHYGRIDPREDLSVLMVAPKAPGHTVRSTYLDGGGVPHLIAIHKDVTGASHEVALAYAIANGGGRAGVIETDFREETETDLFGEQAVLCGGMVELVKCGFEVLVDNGYSPEMAYFECLHELKLIVDLMYEGGISNLNYSISNNAEFGEYCSGPRVVTEQTRQAMEGILKDIQNGTYAQKFIVDSQASQPILKAERQLNNRHQLEVVGRKLRNMMPWIQENALVKV